MEDKDVQLNSFKRIKHDYNVYRICEILYICKALSQLPFTLHLNLSIQYIHTYITGIVIARKGLLATIHSSGCLCC